MSYCSNCSNAVEECKCEDPIFYSDRHATCPYCHHENVPGGCDFILYDTSTTEYECDNCEEEFNVSVMVSYSWETSKKGEGE